MSNDPSRPAVAPPILIPLEPWINWPVNRAHVSKRSQERSDRKTWLLGSIGSECDCRSRTHGAEGDWSNGSHLMFVGEAPGSAVWQNQRFRGVPQRAAQHFVMWPEGIFSHPGYPGKHP